MWGLIEEERQQKEQLTVGQQRCDAVLDKRQDSGTHFIVMEDSQVPIVAGRLCFLFSLVAILTGTGRIY